jgi:hypothetical protein
MAKPEMTMLRVIRLVSDKRASCTSWLPRCLAIVDTAGRVIGAMGAINCNDERRGPLSSSLELLEADGKSVSIRVLLLGPRQPNQRPCGRLEAVLEQRSIV